MSTTIKESYTDSHNGGAQEIHQLHAKRQLRLATPAELQNHTGDITLTGASPVSRVLAAHEIVEIVDTAKAAPHAKVNAWCFSGAEAQKDLSKAMGKQGDHVEDSLTLHLLRTNLSNDKLEEFANQRGFSIRDNTRYLSGNQNLPAINLNTDKTPAATLLSIPSTLFNCPEPDLILDTIKSKTGDRFGVIESTKAAIHKSTQEPTLADILHALSLSALSRYIEDDDPKNELDLGSRIKIFGPRNPHDFFQSPDILNQVNERLIYGTKADESVVSFCCLDCSRQRRQLTKHHISSDGNPRNSNGAGIQHCRDGRTLTLNYVQARSKEVSPHHATKVPTSSLVDLLQSEQTHASGKLTLAALLTAQRYNSDTVIGLRDFPNSRNTYPDAFRIATPPDGSPQAVIITPTFTVQLNGHDTDSPIYASYLANRPNSNVISNGKTRVSFDILTD